MGRRWGAPLSPLFQTTRGLRFARWRKKNVRAVLASGRRSAAAATENVSLALERVDEARGGDGLPAACFW